MYMQHILYIYKIFFEIYIYIYIYNISQRKFLYLQVNLFIYKNKIFQYIDIARDYSDINVVSSNGKRKED